MGVINLGEKFQKEMQDALRLIFLGTLPPANVETAMQNILSHPADTSSDNIKNLILAAHK